MIDLLTVLKLFVQILVFGAAPAVLLVATYWWLRGQIKTETYVTAGGAMAILFTGAFSIPW